MTERKEGFWWVKLSGEDCVVQVINGGVLWPGVDREHTTREWDACPRFEWGPYIGTAPDVQPPDAEQPTSGWPDNDAAD